MEERRAMKIREEISEDEGGESNENMARNDRKIDTVIERKE